MKLLHLHIERSNEDLRRAMEQQYQYMYDITVASRSRIIRIKGIPEDESPEHTLNDLLPARTVTKMSNSWTVRFCFLGSEIGLRKRHLFNSCLSNLFALQFKIFFQ